MNNHISNSEKIVAKYNLLIRNCHNIDSSRLKLSSYFASIPNKNIRRVFVNFFFKDIFFLEFLYYLKSFSSSLLSDYNLVIAYSNSIFFF